MAAPSGLGVGKAELEVTLAVGPWGDPGPLFDPRPDAGELLECGDVGQRIGGGLVDEIAWRDVLIEEVEAGVQCPDRCRGSENGTWAGIGLGVVQLGEVADALMNPCQGGKSANHDGLGFSGEGFVLSVAFVECERLGQGQDHGSAIDKQGNGEVVVEKASKKQALCGGDGQWAHDVVLWVPPFGMTERTTESNTSPRGDQSGRQIHAGYYPKRLESDPQ